MVLHVLETPDLLGQKAAGHTAELINDAIDKNGTARIVMSTGSSQFETINYLRRQKIDWAKVEMFHLDEYIGIDSSHPASFVKYLKERFIGSDLSLKHAYFIDGMRDSQQVIYEMTKSILEKPVDIALIGIGENAHIAFNDPPADFDTKEAFIVVDLDDICKNQQVREGWFNTINDVPKQAITMTAHQIMQAKAIISCVPHSQKAPAIKNVMENEVTNMIPATILKNHENWTLYLDKASASQLN